MIPAVAIIIRSLVAKIFPQPQVVQNNIQSSAPVSPVLVHQYLYLFGRTSNVYKYLRQGRGLSSLDPSFRKSSWRPPLQTSHTSHFPPRVPLQSTTTSRASSHKVPGDFYMTGGRVAFLLCSSSRNVYQRNPGQRTDFRFATGRTLPRRPHHYGGSLSLSSSQEPS